MAEPGTPGSSLALLRIRVPGWSLAFPGESNTFPRPMPTDMLDYVLKSFEEPDEVRTFAKGRFEIVHLAGRTFGRATYQPGWRWSVDVGRELGKRRCDVEHLGLVLAGRAT